MAGMVGESPELVGEVFDVPHMPKGNRGIQVRVRGTIRPVNHAWVEVRLQLQRSPDSEWKHLSPYAGTVLVARQFSGSAGEREAPELYVISALKEELGANGATVELTGSEGRKGDGTTEYRYWAHLSARLTVALRYRSDGSVTVIGLN